LYNAFAASCWAAGPAGYVAAVRCAFRNNNEPGNINNNNNNGFRVVASYFSPYFVEKFQS